MWAKRYKFQKCGFTPQKNSVEIETDGSLMVHQDDKMDASKISNHILSILDESPKMCVVCRDGRQYLFYWSILVAFSRLLGVIFPIVDSRC